MISVCMAVYNGASYVSEQIESILSQLSPNDELVISDDGSTDNTKAIVTFFNDPKIKILTNTNRKGIVGNFENALSFATGEYIFLSDQDDIWYADKIQNTIAALQEYDLIFTNAEIIDRNGETIRKSFYNTLPPKNVICNLIFNHFFGATMAFKRKVLEKALPFPAYIPMHDQWIGVIAALYFKVGYIDKTLIKYRRHNFNASFCGEKSNNNFKQKIMFRYNIIKALINRIL